MLGTVAMLDLQVAACLSVRDGLAAAQSLAERAAANAERLGLKAVAASALVFVAGGLLAQGRRMDMRRALDRAAELDPQSVDVRAWTAGVNGMAALFDDDLPQSVSAFDEAVSSLRQSEVASSTSWWGLWVVTRTTADGRLPPPAPEWPLALVQKANCAALAYAQVVDAGVRGDLTLMRARLTDADRDSQPMPHWHHLMRLLLARAALGASWGQPVAWARESLTYFEGKEPPLAALARNVLRASGEPVPRRRGAVSAVPADLRKVGVTARELEVLTLLRENLTNSEIARRLFLSPRTVETHIKHLMQKVERSSRAGLSDLARSLP
jgi:DNA-binding CsgD family transcriptional regulator